MASSLTISVGPLSRSRTWQNDTKVQATLLLFWQYRFGPQLPEGEPEPSNQAKLDAVLDALVQHVVEEVANQERNIRTETALTTINQNVADEFDFREEG